MNKLTCMYYVINKEVLYFPLESKLAYIETMDQKISLNLPASRCLQFLLENRNKVISREDFLETVWRSNGACVAENTFYQNISILRKSLRLVGLTEDIIITVRRKGFSLAEGIIIERKEDNYEQPEVIGMENNQVSNKVNEMNINRMMRKIISSNVTKFEYWLLLATLFSLLFIELISLGISFFREFH